MAGFSKKQKSKMKRESQKKPQSGQDAQNLSPRQCQPWTAVSALLIRPHQHGIAVGQRVRLISPVHTPFIAETGARHLFNRKVKFQDFGRLKRGRKKIVFRFFFDIHGSASLVDSIKEMKKRYLQVVGHIQNLIHKQTPRY